jgi:hypothetical protein
MDDLSFVVAASVAVAWAFEDETSLYTEAVLEALTEGSASAPAIWPLEVANASRLMMPLTWTWP